MQLVNIENGFSLIENDKVVFSHTIDNPAIFIGKGKEKMDIYRGNFDIEDYVIERYPLKKYLKINTFMEESINYIKYMPNCYIMYTDISIDKICNLEDRIKILES